jgi:hypothetical protein
VARNRLSWDSATNAQGQPREIRYSCLRFTSVTMRGTRSRHQASPRCIRLAYLFFGARCHPFNFHQSKLGASYRERSILEYSGHSPSTQTSGLWLYQYPLPAVRVSHTRMHCCSPLGRGTPAAHRRAEVLSAITSNFIRSTFSKVAVQL